MVSISAFASENWRARCIDRRPGLPFYWMLWFRVGGLEHGKVLRSMELFTKHVMPALREAEVRP